MKEYVYDVCFMVRSNNIPEEVSKKEIIEGLEKRLEYLKSTLDDNEVFEACGYCDEV